MAKNSYKFVKDSIARRTAWFKGIKESKPCTDCKQFFPYYIMEFDHLNPEEKSFGLSNGAHRYSRELLQEEMDKCELVCSNCHKEREHQRRVTLPVERAAS